MSHRSGPSHKDYFSDSVILPDGWSHLEQTVDRVARVVEGKPQPAATETPCT